MNEGYILIVLFTLFGAFGGFYIRNAMVSSESIRDALRNSLLFFGFGFYLISTILNIFALQVLPYVVVLPCSSITYVWSMMIAKGLLKERINIVKSMGLAMVILGAIMVATNS